MRTLVIVLGMHRSGTSLCANALAALGIDMAEAPGPSPANARGHWERSRLNDLHDQVFAMNGAAWNDAGHDLALPADWAGRPGMATVRERIVAYLAPIIARSERAGFKDPRTARLLPMWDAILEALDVTPRFVFCVRNPAQVARSLEARDRTERGQAQYRWLVYNAHAVHGIGSRPVCIIPYEDWFSAPLATARRLAQWVRPEAPDHDALAQTLVTEVLDPRLRHDPPGDAQPATRAAARFYESILNDAAADGVSQWLRSKAEDFLDFEHAAAPLLREVVMLKASVAEQNRAIGDLQALVRRLRMERPAS